ncbi:Uncharacterised protein [Serratia rubidaea]|nr:Uncharacterised protein [Serratia rubidaea]
MSSIDDTIGMGYDEQVNHTKKKEYSVLVKYTGFSIR